MSDEKAMEVWDADNHMYETIDAYTRYLPEKYSEAVKFVDVNGRTKLQILGVVTECIPNPTYEVIPTPGAWADYYRGVNPEGKSLRELAEPIRCPEEFRRPDLRLALMDRQGVDGAVMFPTTAGMLEERSKSDTELTHAVTHAFNRWLLDDWTFNYQNRIFAVPAISLNDPAKGVEELEWCLDNGAKTVLIRPAPVPREDGTSRSPALPEFDDFWRLVESSGISVQMHNSDAGYDRYLSRLGGRRRVPGLPADQVPRLHLRGEPPHLRHACGVHRSRGVRAVPRLAYRCGRERRVVGESSDGRVRPGVPQEATGLRTSTPAMSSAGMCGSTRFTRRTCRTSSRCSARTA